MLSGQVKVRNACEECHKRKIKCVLPPDGGLCNACVTGSRNCYFLPRHKSGRVPKKTAEPSPPSSISSKFEGFGDFGDSVSSNLFRSQRQGTFDAVDPMLATPAFAGSRHRLPTPSTPGGQQGYLNQNMSPVYEDLTQGENFVSHGGYHRGASFSSDSSSSNGPSSMERSISAPIYPQVSWHSPEVLNCFEHPELSVQASFTDMLQKCSDMQRCGESLKNIALGGSFSSAGKLALQSTIQSIDSACQVILEIAGPEPATDTEAGTVPDAKLTALAVAAVFTVFEICEMLVGFKVARAQYIDFTLMWKRLDLNLMQTRVALLRLGRRNPSFAQLIQDAASRAKLLDHRIKSTIRDSRSGWNIGS